MTNDKWKEVLDNIKEKFGVLDEGREHLDDEGGVDVEYMEFQGPLGRMRLEFVTKPVIIDKKMTFSRRIGSETSVEYIYSETEKSEKMMAYKWSESGSEWQKIDSSMFG